MGDSPFGLFTELRCSTERAILLGLERGYEYALTADVVPSRIDGCLLLLLLFLG